MLEKVRALFGCSKHCGARARKHRLSLYRAIVLAAAAALAALGYPHSAAAQPQRIASGVLAADEVLIEIVPPQRLAGVTRAVDDPALSNAVRRIMPGIARHDGKTEELLRLNPDLVIFADYSREDTVQFLSSAAIPVMRLQSCASLADIRSNIRLIAGAADAAERGEALIAEMDRRISAVQIGRSCHRKPRVLYYSEGSITAGSGTVIGEVIELAGGINAAALAGVQGTAEIALEVALQLSPEVILLPGWDARLPESPLAAQLSADPRWRTVEAVRNKELYTIRSAALTTLSHHIASGVEAVAQVLRFRLRSCGDSAGQALGAAPAQFPEGETAEQLDKTPLNDFGPPRLD